MPHVFHFMGIIGAPIIDLPGRPVESFLDLVQSLLRVFTFGESFPEVVLFLLEQLRIAAYGEGPMERIWITLSLAER